MKKLFDLPPFAKIHDPAISVSLKFVFAGILWILFSDSLVTKLSPDNWLLKLAHIHILKGILFVGVTGAVIFSVLHNYSEQLKIKQSQLDKFFRANPTAMVIMEGTSFVIRDVNDAAIKMFDSSKKTLCGLKLDTLVSPGDKSKFQSVLLFIKTGFENLDAWEFKKTNDQIFIASLSSKPLTDDLFIVALSDITKHVELENQLALVKKNLEQQIDKRTEQLERHNEELAYRASQTEHVNAELILVNEQLLKVNKKIARQMEEGLQQQARLEGITDNLGIILWSYDVRKKSYAYLSPSAENLFECNLNDLLSCCIWFDFVSTVERSKINSWERKLDEEKMIEFNTVITSAKQNPKVIHTTIELHQNYKGEKYISGCIKWLQHLES